MKSPQPAQSLPGRSADGAAAADEEAAAAAVPCPADLRAVLLVLGDTAAAEAELFARRSPCNCVLLLLGPALRVRARLPAAALPPLH